MRSRCRSALRAAFGPERGLIRTVSGRGYQFTGDIRAVRRARTSVPARPKPWSIPDRQCRQTNLPEPVSELIGRDDELRKSSALQSGIVSSP